MSPEAKYGPFHRLGDPPDVVDKIAEAGELFGQAPAIIFGVTSRK